MKATVCDAQEVLGEGAFAVVEKALLARRDPATGAMTSKTVAVKKLKPAVLADKIELRAFIEETDVCRRLEQENIVEFQGVGAMQLASAEQMRNSMFLVQVCVSASLLCQHFSACYKSGGLCPDEMPMCCTVMTVIIWMMML